MLSASIQLDFTLHIIMFAFNISIDIVRKTSVDNYKNIENI